MYLIAGLGNPEKKYLDTWHNLGFMCADKLAAKLGVSFDKAECKSMTAHAGTSEKVIIAKPLTYMNLSGEAVAELVHKYKIEKGKLAVVYDDVDIPLGAVRIRKEGSAGTHNGMRSIIKLLGREDFVRVRIGSGKTTPMALVDFVLSKIPQEDNDAVEKALENAALALEEWAKGSDIDCVMQRHNVKAALPQ